MRRGNSARFAMLRLIIAMGVPHRDLCAQMALLLDPARDIMPLDPMLLYNIAPKAAGKPAAFGAFL